MTSFISEQASNASEFQGLAIDLMVHKWMVWKPLWNLRLKPFRISYCTDITILGIHGEHTESVGGVYDLSNKRRLGLTEFQAVEEMRAGVEACLKKEKELEAAAKK